MNYNLILLCEIFMKNEFVTENLLLKKGLSFNDIKSFIMRGYLIKKEDGNYQISVYLMYQYGEKLIKQNRDDLAYKCFDKCYELDNNHDGTNLRLILKSLREYDYEGIIKYLIPLINSNNQTTKSDALIYLYLTNYIVNLSKDLNIQARKIKYNDVRIVGNNYIYKDSEKINEIRGKIINKKFKHALKLLNDYLIRQEIYGVRNNILKSLLVRCLQVEEYFQDNLFNLVFEKKYEELLSFLQEVKDRNNFKTSHEYLLKLTRILLLSNIFGKLPDKNNNYSLNVFDAINNNDFELAKEKCIRRNMKEGRIPEEDYIYLLLDEITKIEYPNDGIYVSNYLYNEIDSYNILFISYLKKNIRILAIDSLYKYLEKVDKLKYLNIFLEILDNINNDYLELMYVLHYISIDNNIEKVKIYIKRLEDNFSNNELNSCYIYMKIIEKIKDEITDKYVLGYINYLLDYYKTKLRFIKKDNKVKKLTYKSTL